MKYLPNTREPAHTHTQTLAHTHTHTHLPSVDTCQATVSVCLTFDSFGHFEHPFEVTFWPAAAAAAVPPPPLFLSFSFPLCLALLLHQPWRNIAADFVELSISLLALFVFA